MFKLKKKNVNVFRKKISIFFRHLYNMYIIYLEMPDRKKEKNQHLRAECKLKGSNTIEWRGSK